MAPSLEARRAYTGWTGSVDARSRIRDVINVAYDVIGVTRHHL